MDRVEPRPPMPSGQSARCRRRRVASEHFAEGLVFGLAFVGMAAYQLVVAGLLVARPSPRAYRAGIWGSALIVAVYLTTRVVPPPTATTPEEITPLGVVATSLARACAQVS